MECCIELEQKEKSILQTIQKTLNKHYVKLQEQSDKIIFYLPPYFYFIDSISSLIFRYIQLGKECIIVLPSEEAIVSIGLRNAEHVVKIIKELEIMGGRCYTVNEQSIYENEYEICFLCSEYSDRIPTSLRSIARYVVALQVTAIYTHMYQIKGRFEDVFSENARHMIDYLVVSDFIGNWICKRDQRWKEKLLCFGYPKLDTLYFSLKNECEIPKKWQDRISGKKVYLFTTNNLEPTWLDFFADKDDARIAIWRPHPHGLNDVERQKKVAAISERYNIIIDDTESYYLSFQISDALIAQTHSSVMMNYLYTGKPICLYERDELYKTAVINYRKEPWYKSAFSTSNAREVLEFIRRIECNEFVVTKEQEVYRKYVTSNFDGKVCDRVYNFFEMKKYRN